jgi:nitroreductase
MKNEIIKSLKERYSVKVFDKAKKIPSDIWNAVEEALVLTPSSFGLEPWKFYIITNQEMKTALYPHSLGQSQIEDCSHLVVFCSKKNVDEAFIKNSIENMAKVRNLPVSSFDGYKALVSQTMKKIPNHLEYTSNQTFIALGSILTIASLLKIDACPIGGFIHEKYNEVLQIPAEYTSSVVCAFGYKVNENDKKQKARKPHSEVIVKID